MKLGVQFLIAIVALASCANAAPLSIVEEKLTNLAEKRGVLDPIATTALNIHMVNGLDASRNLEQLSPKLHRPDVSFESLKPAVGKSSGSADDSASLKLPDDQYGKAASPSQTGVRVNKTTTLGKALNKFKFPPWHTVLTKYMVNREPTIGEWITPDKHWKESYNYKEVQKWVQEYLRQQIKSNL